jgi:predicted RNase H-like HicB family nuclease
MKQNVHVRVRFEDQAFWATVDEYPGVFATGDSLEELRESLEEGITLVMGSKHNLPRVELSPFTADGAEGVDNVASSELVIDSGH